MKEIIAGLLVITGIYFGACAILAAIFTVGVVMIHSHPKKRKRRK